MRVLLVELAGGSGFDTWGLMGSMATLIVVLFQRLFDVYRSTRTGKKGRSTMANSRKKKHGSQKHNYSARQQLKQHAIEAVGAIGAEAFGDQLAS
jgi:hypothetical protein